MILRRGRVGPLLVLLYFLAGLANPTVAQAGFSLHPDFTPEERELLEEAVPNLRHFERDGLVLPKGGACESILLEAQYRLKRLLSPQEIELVLTKILAQTGESLSVEEPAWHRAPRGVEVTAPVLGIGCRSRPAHGFRPGDEVLSMNFRTGALIANKIQSVESGLTPHLLLLKDWGFRVSYTCLLADEAGRMTCTAYEAPANQEVAKFDVGPVCLGPREVTGSLKTVINFVLENQDADNFIVNDIVVRALGRQDQTLRREDWKSLPPERTRSWSGSRFRSQQMSI